jgi:hypothetical protein
MEGPPPWFSYATVHRDICAATSWTHYKGSVTIPK